MDLPGELLEADERFHALLERVRFSAYLNPVNIQTARAAFVRGAEVPPFEYAPATWAEDALAEMDGLRIPAIHPLGVELARAVAETRALVVALHDRAAESFEALATLCGWVPETGEDVPEAPPQSPLSADVPAEDLYYALLGALRERGLDGWEVSWDPVMSSRVLVDAAKRQVRLNPAARFRESDRRGLVAHEIDVHATRGANGARQPMHLFGTGLAGSLLTEEGLAISAEERVGALSPTFLSRQAMVVEAARAARTMGFRELYAWMLERTGGHAAWQIALRVKRGLARPGEPGVYAKDTVYLRGYRRVRAWLGGGGDVARLYVGKVGLDHPVDAWIAEGWIHASPTPALWTGGAA